MIWNAKAGALVDQSPDQAGGEEPVVEPLIGGQHRRVVRPSPACCETSSGPAAWSRETSPAPENRHAARRPAPPADWRSRSCCLPPRTHRGFRVDANTFVVKVRRSPGSNFRSNDDVRKPRDKRALQADDCPDGYGPQRLLPRDPTRDARFDGRFFVGVRTTGIYCRPICPARTPEARERRRSMPRAAAAQEAGFRPCLRCRPESSPDLAAWRGTSNTVSRALTLIEAGGLDAGDVEGLARPARRRRAPAAPAVSPAPRRLAGRGGADAPGAARQAADPRDDAADDRGRARLRLRQRAPLQRDLPRTCTAARRRRCAAARGRTQRAKPARCRSRLAYRPPYDWDAMLAFLAARAIPGVEVVAGDSYRRTIAIGDARRRDRRGAAPRRNRVDVTDPISRHGGAARRSSRGCGACSIWPPIPPRSARIWRRIRRWRRWSRRGPACACRAPGTASSSRCARSSASRSPLPARDANCSASWSRPTASRCRAAAADGEGLSHVFPSPGALAGGRSRRLGMPARAPRARDLAGAAIAADPASSAAARASRRRSPSCARCRASANGPRSTSPCARCASPTRSPPPTSGCCARWRMPDGADRRRPSCWRAPSAGGPGAPTPRCICGLRAPGILPLSGESHAREAA